MPAPSPTQVLTVTEITRRIKGVLEDKFPGVWIEGEISNLRVPGSGHFYFTLKDAGAQINAAGTSMKRCSASAPSCRALS